MAVVFLQSPPSAIKKDGKHVNSYFHITGLPKNINTTPSPPAIGDGGLWWDQGLLVTLKSILSNVIKTSSLLFVYSRLLKARCLVSKRCCLSALL